MKIINVFFICLTLLSKYKIFDNLRRSLLEFSLIVSIIYSIIIGTIYGKENNVITILLITIAIIPFILELINNIIFKKEGEEKQKTFTPKISGIKGSVLRGILTLGCLPFKANTSIKAALVTLYRVLISHKHLLEWTTSEEAEKQSKSSLMSYYNMMKINVILGIFSVIVAIVNSNVLWIFLGIYMLITPFLMYFISKEEKDKEAISTLNKEDKEYIKDIGKKTWDFFEEYLTEENNYLIPDNYQEDRKELVVPRTSSTNIGLSMLAVISAIDLGYIEKEKAIELLKNIILSVESLQKWNGHLYNWYNIKTKEPLIPRYISNVESGKFVAYLY